MSSLNKFYKKAALFVLRAIAKHSSELALTIVNNNGLHTIIECLEDFDPGVKEAAAWALGYIARHNENLAQLAVDAGAVSLLVLCLQEPELYIKQISASAINDICKHNAELAQAVVDATAISILVKILNNPDTKVKGIIHLALVLQESTEDHVLAVTVWTIGQIGKHTPEHAKTIAVANILLKLLNLHNNPRSSEDLKAKCNMTLKQILQKCMYVEALEPMLHDVPPNILKYVLGQFSKILPNDTQARRLFVTSGGLKKVQEIQAEPGTILSEYITIINCCFPEEIVRYYSPGYPDSLLEAVEQYQPKCIFSFDHRSSSDPNLSTLFDNNER